MIVIVKRFHCKVYKINIFRNKTAIKYKPLKTAARHIPELTTSVLHPKHRLGGSRKYLHRWIKFYYYNRLNRDVLRPLEVYACEVSYTTLLAPSICMIPCSMICITKYSQYVGIREEHTNDSLPVQYQRWRQYYIV